MALLPSTRAGIWSTPWPLSGWALLLEHLGQPAAAKDIVSAIERNLFEGRIKTYDLGGSSTTSECGSELLAIVGLI